MQKRQYSTNKTIKQQKIQIQVRHGGLPITQHLRHKAGGASVQEWFTDVCSGQPGLHKAH